MLATTIVIVHLAIVLGIVAGLPLIYIGCALGWRWVRDWRWRMVHVGAIVFVAAQSLAGIVCPLTRWENALRGQESREGFIEHWVDRMLFYDLPTRAFSVIYVVFAAAVLATWFAVPPEKR